MSIRKNNETLVQYIEPEGTIPAVLRVASAAEFGKNTRRLFLATLAATSFATSVRAQSNAPGPLVTSAAELQFARVDHDFGNARQEILDRFGANTLAHFDDVGNANHIVTRTLVQTGPAECCMPFATLRHLCIARVSACR